MKIVNCCLQVFWYLYRVVDTASGSRLNHSCVCAGRLQRSYCPLRACTAIRHVRTEPSAASSFAGAYLDGMQHSDSEEDGPNLAKKPCSSARSFMHNIIAVAIPAWLALKRIQFQQWVADGEAKADTVGMLHNLKRSVLVIPFASAVTGAKGPSELFIMLNQAVYHFVNLYLLFLFIRWVPSTAHIPAVLYCPSSSPKSPLHLLESQYLLQCWWYQSEVFCTEPVPYRLQFCLTCCISGT